MTDPKTARDDEGEEDDEIQWLDLLQVIAENLRLLVLGPLAAGVLAFVYCLFITPTFIATTKFLVPSGQSANSAMLQSLGALGGLAGAPGLKSPGDQFVSFINSRSVQDALVERFKLTARYNQESQEGARKILGGMARIENNIKDGLITVEVEDPDREFAAQLANGHVEELQKVLNGLAVTEAQQRRAFFEKLLVSTKDKWIKAEQALKASGVNSSVLKVSPQSALEGVAKLNATITAQEVKLSTMRGYLTEDAPDFRQAQVELAALKSQLVRNEKAEPASAPGDSDYIARYRDFKYNETLFDLFSKQYEIARVDESREGTIIQVLDIAKPPEHKSKPKKVMIATIAAVGCLVCLIGLVFILRSLRTALGNAETGVKIRALGVTLLRAFGR